MSVDREEIRTGYYQNMVKEAEKLGLLKAMSDEDRRASRQAVMDQDPFPESDYIQVFAYGSLIWNPAFEYESRFSATLDNYHRAFCLWTPVGRGSVDIPGLVLALDEGGSCDGVVYKIRKDHAATELDIIWSREMVTASYIPCWLDIVDREGKTSKAISFVIDHSHDRYAGTLEFDRLVYHIANARGELGPCAEYLQNTVNALEFLAIHDEHLNTLWRAVRQELRRTSIS